VDLKDIEVIKDYTGLRSGSNDYLPMIGAVVDADTTVNEDFKPSKIKQMSEADFTHYNGLYMINGTGGYGFVLAPFLAKQLCEHIVQDKPLDTALIPSRFFRRWAKKLS